MQVSKLILVPVQCKCLPLHAEASVLLNIESVHIYTFQKPACAHFYWMSFGSEMESCHHCVHVRGNVSMKLKNYASHLRPIHLCCLFNCKVCSLHVLFFSVGSVVVESCTHSLQEILEAVEFYHYKIQYSLSLVTFKIFNKKKSWF